MTEETFKTIRDILDEMESDLSTKGSREWSELFEQRYDQNMVDLKEIVDSL